MDRQVRSDRADQPHETDVLNEHRVDAGRGDLPHQRLKSLQLIAEHERVECHVTLDASLMQLGHDLREIVRPHDINVYGLAVTGGVRATVTQVQRVGNEVRLTASAGDAEETTVQLSRAHLDELAAEAGDEVWLRLAPGASRIATADAK